MCHTHVGYPPIHIGTYMHVCLSRYTAWGYPPSLYTRVYTPAYIPLHIYTGIYAGTCTTRPRVRVRVCVGATRGCPCGGSAVDFVCGSAV
nr:MAG TPA: hypothetical protein [Caudoviricetes sp.]